MAFLQLIITLIYRLDDNNNCFQIITTRQVGEYQQDIDVLSRISSSWGLSLNSGIHVMLRFIRGTFPEHDRAIQHILSQ